jgi:hypothetical protein
MQEHQGDHDRQSHRDKQRWPRGKGLLAVQIQEIFVRTHGA